MTPDITLADAITALVAEKRAVGYTYAAEEMTCIGLRGCGGAVELRRCSGGSASEA